MLWLGLQNVIMSFPGLEVIKLEFVLRLKIKCNDWLQSFAFKAIIQCIDRQSHKEHVKHGKFNQINMFINHRLQKKFVFVS